MSDSAPEVASRVWLAMRDFMATHDRRRPLLEAFDFGRGMGRVNALLRLEKGPMTLRELADAQGVDAPFATSIVNQLEERGLVSRAPHPEGRRRKLVTLTEAGRQHAVQAREIIERPPTALNELSAKELTSLEDMLTRLRVAGPPPTSPPTASRTETETKDIH